MRWPGATPSFRDAMPRGRTGEGDRTATGEEARDLNDVFAREYAFAARSWPASPCRVIGSGLRGLAMRSRGVPVYTLIWSSFVRHLRPLVLLLLLGPTGCYHVKYHNSAVDTADKGRVDRVYQHSVLWGAVTFGSVDLGGHCRDTAIKAVDSHIGGLGLLGFWLTGGFWAPMRVKITCTE